MKCTSRISSMIPRSRSRRSVANLRRGSVISIWRPVISTLIGDPPTIPEAARYRACASRAASHYRSGPEATLVCTRNFQIFPILCDAAARDGDTLFFQHLSNLLVGQRNSWIFVLDKLLDLPLHDQQRCAVPHRAIHCLGKKEPQLEHALRRVRKLIGDSAADSRRMHPDFFSHVFDHHRLQLVDSSVKKVSLPADDGFANFDDDVFALLDIFQKLDSRLETVLDVIFHVFVYSAPLEHVAVRRAQAKLRHLVLIRDDLVLPADFPDEDY